MNSNMCKELVPRTRYMCFHVLDQPSFLTEWKDCGNCGRIEAGPEYLAQTTKKLPCEDCKSQGKWVWTGSKWQEARVEPDRNMKIPEANLHKYMIDTDTALKYPRDPTTANLVQENKIYDDFEKHEPSPYVIQSFLRLPNANFMPFLSGGSLQKRLESNQRLDDRHNFLSVLRLEPMAKIERWAAELSGAVAWLESLGLVHGDLRPENLLLDAGDHLKLVDFDCVDKIGNDSQGNPPPWARVLGSEAGAQRGSFGINGPRTEQFAIGSLLYTMTRGHEPYAELEPGPHIVHLLRDMKFPELGQGCLDAIIDRCWKGLYDSVESLAKETAGLNGAVTLPHAEALDQGYISEMRDRCQRLVDEGLLDTDE
ncbi:hypothetical protein CDV36_006607 [Fusarium kuroshium]|uniref:EKC/KEOPS complex subunit BUD32 n=1 Tax=Fusarium kuroshium TaxID=2010991 RepID=A0A3M2S838_9HYPO|nr:hypothetical protein CDV36_006607 [Fusarium kuroshium]